MKAFIFLSLIALSFPASADERSVTVKGACLRNLLLDRGSVTVTSDILDKDVSVASKKVTGSYNKFRDAVQKLNLKDLQLTTTESSTYEQKDWVNGKEVSRGYRVRMGLQVSTSETSRLGEVIAVAGQHGIKSVGGLSLFLSPEKLKTERESCLEEATRNARAKANSVAIGAGMKLGKALRIQEDSAGGDSPAFLRQAPMMAERKEMDVAPVDSAPEKFNVEVTATFEMN